jgi:photosystem II stability/assembly factor-like uncharacterized protein
MSRKALMLTLAAACLCALAAGSALAAPKAKDKSGKDDAPWSSGDFSALKWRGLGPALASGRVGDFAVDPRDKSHYYVAVCSGGVWETRNAGITFDPIFDGEGSYSIGCVTLAPSRPGTVWVGSGENNSQRSVSYGDGVYRSLDGGRNWQNMGLKRSLHIGKIIVHPTDPDVVYVAAMGPLWGPGGDRGVYKTTDGGTTWQQVLAIDENTGVVDLEIDPRDPDVLYAASYQRRRHTWTLINGGPGSGIHKTTDGGKTWTKLAGGLPSVDMGRIGLALAGPDPDVVYAIVEAADGKGGFFRSVDAGLNWEKRDGYMSSSPQYYNEIIADPLDTDRVYSMDTFMMVTEDGGSNWSRVGWEAKHVDEHALWIDPDNTKHMLTGNDGGMYETWDRGDNWAFMANLPVTQFYRVAVDNDEPFYNIYGGTQDNNTQGGPSQTHYVHGISNREWFMLIGGDGFEPAPDPTNPDIIYCQSQYGGLCRFDRRSGEALDIQPQPAEGEALRWNWDSPLIVSPHDPKRLYFAAQRVFRSDDQGSGWKPVSGDLSRQTDRNRLEVMGRVWSVDAVAKNNSTSFYGNIVSLAESPQKEGLLLAGTDDGLIQVTVDGGANWTRIDGIKGVPEGSYVSDLEPSPFDQNVIYASFENHKRDDFKPYVLRSGDQGRTWTMISGNLPANGPVHTIALDHVDPELVFVGTEFGVFFTRDNGSHWTQLKSGLPTIACRDLEIQRREGDLVVATFGRGFYVLDDYSPLRGLAPATLEKAAVVFPVKTAKIHSFTSELGYRGRGFQGAGFYTAENPPYGAVFTYHLKEGLETLKDQRQAAEKDKEKAGQPVYYPSWDELRAEEREVEPELVITLRDQAGNVVRRLKGDGGKGLHRVAWDLRHSYTGPVNLGGGGPRSPWDGEDHGPQAAPGTYSVSLSQRVRGVETELAGPVTFTTELLGTHSTPDRDPQGTLAFAAEAAEMYRAVQGAGHVHADAVEKVGYLRQAVLVTPAADRALLGRIDALAVKLADLGVQMDGDDTVARRQEPTTPGISSRVGQVVSGLDGNLSGATTTMRESLAVAKRQFGPVLAGLEAATAEIRALEAELEKVKAPYTPGRLPTWGGTGGR